MKNNKIAALPFFQIVRGFAFLAGLPFVFLKDQMDAINLYNESIKKAAGGER